MSSVIDTLEIAFAAETRELAGQLGEICGMISSVENAGIRADNSLKSMGNALNFSMNELNRRAFAAGAAVGDSFAAGLRSRRGNVDGAVRYLISGVREQLERIGKYGGAAESAAFSAAPAVYAGISGGYVSAAGDRGARTISAARHRETVDITIPINVDGVRLGEACLRGLERISSMNGRGILNL